MPPPHTSYQLRKSFFYAILALAAIQVSNGKNCIPRASRYIMCCVYYICLVAPCRSFTHALTFAVRADHFSLDVAFSQVSLAAHTHTHTQSLVARECSREQTLTAEVNDGSVSVLKSCAAQTFVCKGQLYSMSIWSVRRPQYDRTAAYKCQSLWLQISKCNTIWWCDAIAILPNHVAVQPHFDLVEKTTK